MELAELHLNHAYGAVPIDRLRARSLRCEAPECSAEIPLVRAFRLGKQASGERARAAHCRARRGVFGCVTDPFRPNIFSHARFADASHDCRMIAQRGRRVQIPMREFEERSR